MATVGKVITCRAAVCWARNESLTLEEVTIDPPKENEVRVHVVSTSFCHSDLHGIQGRVIEGVFDAAFPAIFGHEGAGVVESVGPGVTSVRAGDHVLPLFAPQCGECALCRQDGTNGCLHSVDTRKRGVMMDGTTRMHCKGKPVYSFLGCSTFSEYFVIDEPCLAKIDPRVDLSKASVLGCCIPTGVGAARTVARVRPGSVCAVWGLGAVGLAVALGCKISGAATIIGIDLNAEKEETAKKFGCTEFINPRSMKQPIAGYLVERFGGGCDFTFESIGNAATIQAAYDSVRPGGGKCVVLGICSGDDKKAIAVDPLGLVCGKELRGCLFGGLRFRFDVRALVDEVLEGKIDCGLFITDTIKIDKINWAIDEMKAGRGIRYVLVH